MTIDRKIAPAIHDAIEFDYILPPITTQTLSNGLAVYWLNGGVQDVVEIDWVFPAGLWYEPSSGIAHATAGLLKNGTHKRTAQQINEALEFYGATVKANAGNDFATVTLYSLTKHLPQVLPILFEMFTEASFPEDEIATYKQNTIQRLLVSLRQSEFVANQRIDAMIFGENHPYGRFTQKETIEALSQEGIKTFYKKHYDLSGVQIFMAGKVGAEEVAVLEEIFGGVSINKNSKKTVAASITPDSNRLQHLVNDPNSVQAAIRIGKRFPNRLDPDFAPMIVLNTLFGGYFGSRLMSNIREEKGYTYGIYSSLSPFIHDGALTIHTEVGRDVYEDAVKEIYKEMEIICSETIDEEELLLVKNYLLGNMLGDLDGPFSILHRWRTLILNGLTVEHFNKNINIYKNVTVEELSAIARKHFTKESFFEITVI